MKSLSAFVIVISLGASGAAMAEDDCRSPMSAWQSRDAATARATALGIEVARLRIDDGCYEIRGRDRDGNRVELKLDPATLDARELEVRFRRGADAGRYLSGALGSGPAPAMPGVAGTAPPANPLITPGTVPQARTN